MLMVDINSFQEVFRSTFSGENGKAMLYWILSECGYFATDPSLVKPELIAFCNKLLFNGGVTYPTEAGRYMESLIDVARNAKKIEEGEELDEI